MASDTIIAANGLYGTPSSKVVDLPEGAIQFSPLVPGSSPLEAQAEGALASMLMLTPPGALERRYAMGLGLRAVTPGGSFTALAQNDRGGNRLHKELRAFGCEVFETARRHHRIVSCKRPAKLEGLDESLRNGGPRIVKDLGLWSQPGVFSWDRIDPGTALLIDRLPALSGRGADFGCGIGILSRAVLASPKVKQMTLIDIDKRAVECARHNIDDPRVRFVWDDVRDQADGLTDLDFVVMNAPFHDGGEEDRALPQKFVERAAAVLHKSGVCWLTANRHLPYEAVMQSMFKHVQLNIQASGYKIYEAHK